MRKWPESLIRRDNPELAWMPPGVVKAFVQRVQSLEEAYRGVDFYDMSGGSVAHYRARKEFGFDA